MSDLRYTEETFARTGNARKPSFIMGLVIKLGIAQDEKGAQIVLWFVVVLLFLCMLGYWLWGADTTAGVVSPQEFLEKAHKPQPRP